jgi:V-type H+-transporting ATPase subunit D
MSKNAVVPSRMNLNIYKTKIVSAKKGHELLKKKCDALKSKFRQIMIALLDTKKLMGTDSDTAYLSYAKAQWAAGEFANIVKDSVKRATLRLGLESENIAGVQLPIFTIKEFDDADSTLTQIGISRGGQEIQRCRERFKELLMQLVKIASLQTSFLTLDQVIKVTNRRVNALEYIVIPRFVGVQDYIKQELDEMSKEDFSRLKKVLDNKRRILELEKIENDKKQVEKDKYEANMKAKGLGSKIQQEDVEDDDDDDSQLLKI